MSKLTEQEKILTKQVLQKEISEMKEWLDSLKSENTPYDNWIKRGIGIRMAVLIKAKEKI